MRIARGVQRTCGLAGDGWARVLQVESLATANLADQCLEGCRESLSIREQPFRLVNHIVHLREDFILQLRMVADPGVERGYAAHGRIERTEQVARDAGGEFGAIAPAQTVLMANSSVSTSPSRTPIRRRRIAAASRPLSSS